LIADEIYEDMTFGENRYIPLARLTCNVPILTCSGLAKRFLVPGWRFGWIAIKDSGHDLSEIRDGLFDLSGLIVGANTLTQAALPGIFEKTPETFYQNTTKLMESNAEIISLLLGQVEGLRVIKPQGALYALVGLEKGFFEAFADGEDIQFSEMLLAEQSVSVLPGTVSLAKSAQR
jgi:tyrosine aminotransferase